ncbi:MAG: hypothetical protein Q7R49_02975 [Candidatus Daviesbacteria bacterium]|nr:hypothetical protein [Candidatus Daviesbacteria bacterium]
MQHIERELKRAGEGNLAQIVAVVRKEFQARGHGKDIPLPGTQIEVATMVQPEVLGEPLRFTDEERKALVDDGAVLYLPTGETIKAQQSAKRPFWYITDGYKESGRNRVTEFPSRPIEVAIYPDPERFFVPDTSSKTTDQQIALVEQDAHALREKLGLPNIGEVLPEASEATEVLFKHFDATGVRILGQDYMKDGYWSYIRTNTPTNKEGSSVAHVGGWSAGRGLRVGGWYRGPGHVVIHAARWVVPTGTR